MIALHSLPLTQINAVQFAHTQDAILSGSADGQLMRIDFRLFFLLIIRCRHRAHLALRGSAARLHVGLTAARAATLEGPCLYVFVCSRVSACLTAFPVQCM